jgi:hypothetical protein
LSSISIRFEKVVSDFQDIISNFERPVKFDKSFKPKITTNSENAVLFLKELVYFNKLSLMPKKIDIVCKEVLSAVRE